MFDNSPANLPTGGKSLLDTVNGAAPAAKKITPAAAPAGGEKIISGPPPKVIREPELPSSPPLAPTGAAEDMFDGVKEVPAPAAASVPVSEKTDTLVETPRQGFKNILIAIGSIIFFAGILVAGGYWAYTYLLKPKPLPANLNFNNQQNINAQPAETAQPAAQQQTEQPAAPVVVDSDNDGLSDKEEVTLGADPLNPDTDGDGLFDGEEVNVYHTDPLNPDTDGDGYEDGAEVKNGYDPAGPGKLIKIPAGQ